MHLARSFAKTNKALEVANAALEANNKATMPELQEVRNVQMSLMPHTAPEIEGLEIAGRCLAAREVSGDFFDYLQAVPSYKRLPLSLGM